MRSACRLSRRGSAFALTALLVLALLPLNAAAATGDWLTRLNDMRASARDISGSAGLAPVFEDPALSYGCWLHTRYMSENNVIEHTEDASNPWYTPQGLAAAESSNLSLGVGGADAIDGWAEGPFHGIAMIDPRLHTVGFGTYSAVGRRDAAALDVLQGRMSTVPAGTTFPIVWPGPNTTTPYNAYRGNEWPDPLSGTGYTEPSGLPIIAQFAETPVITEHRVWLDNGQELPHVVVTEGTYTNPDTNAQSTGRSVLRGRKAVFVIPKDPLLGGRTYTVRLVSNGVPYQWSFRTAALVPAATNLWVYFEGTPYTVTGVPYGGGNVTIRSSITQESGSLIPSANVWLERSFDGVSFANTGIPVTVVSSGKYSVTVRVTRPTWFRMRYGGVADTYLPSSSEAIKALPKAYLTTPTAPKTASRSKAFTSGGYLKPRHTAGTYPVAIQAYRRERQANGTYKWILRVTKAARASSYSSYTKYSGRVRLPSRGRWRIRARHSDAKHYTSYSGWRYVTVR